MSFISFVQMKDYMYMVIDDGKVHMRVLIHYISRRAHDVDWHPTMWQLDLSIRLN